MDAQWWSWILTAVGLTGFYLAGRKVWWCWYINIACQGLWFAYAWITDQWGFIVSALVYTVVFTQNAVKWTEEHRGKKREPVKAALEVDPGDLKMLHETLCIAEGLMNRLHAASGSLHDGRYISPLLREIERHRPLGSNGKHGTLHTETCGCEDR